MLRIGRKLAAWHAVYRQASPAVLSSSAFHTLKFTNNSDKQCCLAKAQPNNPRLNYLSNRTFLEAFSHPEEKNTVNIYNGGLAIRLEFLKIYAVCAAVAGVGKYNEIYESISQLGGIFTTVSLCSLTGFVIAVVPVVLHWFSQRYVVDMRYHPQKDEYTAAKISLWMSKKFVSLK